ncbi:MAG: glycosyltransferase [Candidatus Altiarchaeales archaeon]|nr:glycosyltransferase [Candidatus Altiarchaeales archaeon]MBD3415560.1 glycosyltransferase [Candidatus Altiarchaeales archaeon]
MKTLVVLPAYNESPVLAETLEKLRGSTKADMLVVDDGSSDGTGDIALKSGARVVRHVVNLGLGAALETGFEVSRREGYDRVVTFDADGQHNPEDMDYILESLDTADVVIGVREIHGERMPWVKKMGNTVLNLLTGLVFGVYSRDSQSGFRAFNRKAVKRIRVRANRYEVSSEILYEAKRNGLKVKEVPVEVIYTEHSMSRGTGVLDGFKILWRMIIHNR